VRELTLREVQEQHGGILPPDAVFRPDDDEIAATAAARQAVQPTPTAKPRRRTRSERFAVLNAFADYTLAGLGGAEAKVWLILFRDTKANGLARTGQADLARRAGLTVRGVQKTLDKLQTKGLVQVVRRGRLNTGPSVYRVHPVPS
jgi:CRP-like cAMP-binding protein